jgi:uracil-DNA glycosylase
MVHRPGDRLVPKLLGAAGERVARRAALEAPHMQALVRFVHELRATTSSDLAIPDLDPLDGGCNAELLFVLEAPGPQAVATGFVSRDNPDETAKNFLELMAAADLPRSRTAVWNIVPWYIGEAGRIRAARSADLRAGFPYLLRLLALLPRVRGVVLVGRKAQRVAAALTRARPELHQHRMSHPSPMFVNRAPEHRAQIAQDLRRVTRWLMDASQE